MSKYRKKPVVIEARRNDATGYLDENGVDVAVYSLAKWCGGHVLRGGAIDIITLEGTMVASVGDWIIQGVKGEFYPCKPDIFDATYEPVQDTPSAEGGES